MAVSASRDENIALVAIAGWAVGLLPIAIAAWYHDRATVDEILKGLDRAAPAPEVDAAISLVAEKLGAPRPYLHGSFMILAKALREGRTRDEAVRIALEIYVHNSEPLLSKLRAAFELGCAETYCKALQ